MKPIRKQRKLKRRLLKLSKQRQELQKCLKMSLQSQGEAERQTPVLALVQTLRLEEERRKVLDMRKKPNRKRKSQMLKQRPVAQFNGCKRTGRLL